MAAVTNSQAPSTAQTRTAELELESRIGGLGTVADRKIPIIDLSNFEAREQEISDQLWDAAVNVGFFQLKNHGIPNELIDQMFSTSKRFFELPTETKSQWPMKNNAGWEYESQVRPSTGTQDKKESYQITLPRMKGLFPTESEMPGFRQEVEHFEKINWELAIRILRILGTRMGMSADMFANAHSRDSPAYQSTLRLLHYFAQREEDLDPRVWRAGAHTDFTSLTLLHQRDNQGGLEVCPGMASSDLAWTPVKPVNYLITCNIGDMLMRWSDDQLKSTLHRVRSPRRGEDLSARYSVVYFCQANEDAVLRGPLGKYPSTTAKEFIDQRLKANYALLLNKAKA